MLRVLATKLRDVAHLALRMRRTVAASLVVLATVLSFPLALAQTISPDLLKSLSPEMLRALQQGQVEENSAPAPTVETYLPAQTIRDREPPSRLEQIYLQRSGEVLKQFGYDALGEPASVSINQAGAVSDRYVVSAGDEVVITFRGQENAAYRVRVSRDGTVTLPKLSPILAAGQSLGSFRSQLEAQVAQAFLSTQVFVSLGTIHQLSVLVSGEVRTPGARIVSGLASPLDAILLSGGIKKSGSLRNIRISGPGGTRTVDLYSVVAQGGSPQLGPLRDGDTVYVPPVSATTAVAGAVTRPGIYELPPGASGAPASTLLRLAGGVEIAGSYKLAKISVLSNGTLSLLPTTATALVRSGEVLVILVDHGVTEGRISLRGAVAAPGVYPLSANATAGDLFHSAADLTYDGYAAFALILRRNPATNAVTIIPFSISAAIRHTNNIPLQREDLIFVLKRTEAAALTSLVTKNINDANSSGAAASPSTGGFTSTQRASQNRQDLPPGVEAPPDTTAPAVNSAPAQPPTLAIGSAPNAGNGALPLAGIADQSDPRYRPSVQQDSTEAAALAQARALEARSGARAQSQSTVTDIEVIDHVAGLLHVTNDALLRTAADNLTWVLDEVREPGAYLGGPGSSVADIIEAAGGAQQSADLSSIEVTSTTVDQLTGIAHTTRLNYSGGGSQVATVAVRPLDVIRLRPVYSDREEGTVTVSGQVRYPGVFDITRDEHLSTLLKRAGGLSEVAYPYGAVFTRRDAAIAERQGNERAARELEGAVPTLVLSQSSQGPDLANAGIYLATLARSLRETPALGRIVITADPAVLALRPNLDLVLQPGDTLFIPKRPSTVTVSGEVLNPGAFQFRRGLLYSDYVKMAGGATQSADDGRIYIVFPDGSSTPIDSGWLSFGSRGDIPPGSTIVVPRDLRPFNWFQFIKDVTQIASQLAVTAASLAVLNK